MPLLLFPGFGARIIYYPFMFYENDLFVRKQRALTKELKKSFKWIMKLAKRKRGTFFSRIHSEPVQFVQTFKDMRSIS